MREDLRRRFQALAERIDALSLRERALVFVALLVVIYVLAVNLVFAPLNAEKDRLEKALNDKRAHVQALEAQVQAILIGQTAEADPAKRARLNALQARLAALDQALAGATSGLVAPKEMARLVEKMLLKNRGLTLVKLENLPAAPLLEGAAQSGAGLSAVAVQRNLPAGQAGLYKHGLRLELRGQYMDILNYLQELEALPWKVFWGQVTLQTETYPVSRVNLLIYTLSTREGVIGL